MKKVNKPAGLKAGILLGAILGLLIFYCELIVCKSFYDLFGGGLMQTKKGFFAPLIVCLDNSPLLVLVFFMIAFTLGIAVPLVLIGKTNLKDDRGLNISSEATHGSSRFMSEDLKHLAFDMRSYGKPDGFILGVDKETNELITVPWEHPNPAYAPTNRNIALFGPPGTRKTSGVLLPNIYSCIAAGHSIAVTDPKGEIYRETIAAAKMHDYNVKILNLLPGQFKNSDGWDILKLLRESDSPQDMADLIAHLLLKNIDESFWNDANMNFLKLALLYVAKAKAYSNPDLKNSSGNDRTIQAVYHMICSSNFEKNVAAAIANSGSDGGDPHDKELLEMPFNMWKDHSQKDSIKAGLGMRLGFLQNETVARVLSEDDIDFKELSDKKTIIYVICSDQEKTYKCVLTLFSSFLFKETVAYADSKPTGALDRPLYIFFEEMNNIGKIPDLDVRVATLRSRNIGMIFCYQDVGQIMSTYSDGHEGKYEWNTILGGCSIKLCLGGGEQMTREYFSKESGQMTIRTKSEAKEVPVYNPIKFVTEVREMEKEEKRPVLLPDEIKKLELSQILIFPFNKDPLLENKYFYKHHPYYKIRMMDKKTGKPVSYSHHTHKPKWRKMQEQLDFLNRTGLQMSEENVSGDEGYEPHYFHDFYVIDKTEEADKTGLSSWVSNLIFKEVDTEPKEEKKKTAASFDTFREASEAYDIITDIEKNSKAEEELVCTNNSDSGDVFESADEFTSAARDDDFTLVDVDDVTTGSVKDDFFIVDDFEVFGKDARD